MLSVYVHIALYAQCHVMYLWCVYANVCVHYTCVTIALYMLCHEAVEDSVDLQEETDLVHTYIHMYDPLRQVHSRIVVSAPKTMVLPCDPQQKYPNLTPL